jgi:hypothetical protein
MTRVIMSILFAPCVRDYFNSPTPDISRYNPLCNRPHPSPSGGG